MKAETVLEIFNTLSPKEKKRFISMVNDVHTVVERSPRTIEEHAEIVFSNWLQEKLARGAKKQEVK